MQILHAIRLMRETRALRHLSINTETGNFAVLKNLCYFWVWQISFSEYSTTAGAWPAR